MPLLNDFRVGADPEFVVAQNGHLQRYSTPIHKYSPWGLDHGGYVIEPHPKPALSVRELIKNIKIAMNDFAVSAPEGVWRSEPYSVWPERTITLGGHVHIDKVQAEPAAIRGMDLLVQHLEALDILPASHCTNRRNAGHAYGRFGDVRAEHGHYEYRTFPSWLFSQRVTKLCLTGAKLIVADPEGPITTLGSVASTAVTKLKSFFERYQNKDDDADWLLSSGMMDRKLAVKPDRDLRTVWKVEPASEGPIKWKEEEAIKTRVPATVQPVGRALSNLPIAAEHRFFQSITYTPSQWRRLMRRSVVTTINEVVHTSEIRERQLWNLDLKRAIHSLVQSGIAPSETIYETSEGVPFRYMGFRNQLI